MGTKKLKEKKKKARERNSKEKVLAKRISIRKSAKKDKEIANTERKTRDRIVPYVNPEKRDKKIKEQLEHNLEILKTLEKEYTHTEDKRKELNNELETEGCVTLKDKLDALESEKNEERNVDENYHYQELKSK